MSSAVYILRAVDIIGTFLLWTWWLIIVGGLWWLKKKYEKHPIEVVIIEKRGDNLIKTNDRAGKIEEKETSETKYQLKKSKETMPVINFDLMLHAANKPLTMFEKVQSFLMPTIGTVFLFKYGSRQYKPISVKAGDKTMKLSQVRDNKGQPVMQYTYEQFDPRWVLGVIDFEVVDWDNMNFMVQEQRSSVMRRAKGMDWLKQLAVPIAMIAGATIAGIFILKFSAESGAQLAGGGPQQQVANEASERPDAGVIGGAIDGALAPGS